jgi:hypothetical protein
LLGTFAIMGIASLAIWSTVIAAPGWDPNPEVRSPPDAVFTWVPAAVFAAGMASGFLGRGRGGWVVAAAGLVVGTVVAAMVWGQPKLVDLTSILVELVPLSLGYAIGSVLAAPDLRERLLLPCAAGLWVAFAPLVGFAMLWAVSAPGLGERDWPTVVGALLVVAGVPVGLVLVRRSATRLLGRAILVVVGWGVATWALLDGGYGQPLWAASVSVPVFAVMMAGVVLGFLTGLAALVYRPEPPLMSPTGDSGIATIDH